MFKESIMKALLTSPSNSELRKKYQSYAMPDLETEDYGGQKLSDHLQQTYKEKMFVLPNFMLDHSYCKPLNWRQEKNPLIKPVANLFIPKPEDADKQCDDDDQLDVEGGLDVPKPWYDQSKAQVLMNECRKHISLVRADEGDMTWEHRIDRTGWSLAQTRLFDRTCRILNGDRLGRLAIVNHHNEPMLRRILVNKTARKFRALMCVIYWDSKLTHWLHNTLLDNLEMSYLVAYVDILQTLKSKIPDLIERLLQGPTSSKTNVGALNVLVQRPWDPASLTFPSFNLRKLPGNPILVVVPNTPGSKRRPNRWLPYLSQLGQVTSVNTNAISYTSKMTLITSLDQMVAATRLKLTDIRKDYPTNPIILVGMHSGAALACQVALLDVVHAVICLGFPVRTVEGLRGLPDDTLLSMSTPVVFVIGQQAACASVDEMEELREQVPNCETGLIVVGGADDFLRVPKFIQHAEGVTQHVIDKCIIEEVGEFIGGIGKSTRSEELSLSSGLMKVSCPPPHPQPRVKMIERRRKISLQEAMTSPQQEPPLLHPDDNLVSPEHDPIATSPYLTKRGRKPRAVTTGRGRGRWGPRPTSRLPPRGRYSSGDPVSPTPGSSLLVSDVLQNSGETSINNGNKSMPQIRVVGSESGSSSSNFSAESSNLVEQLTPDRLLEMPIIIAPDEASSNTASNSSSPTSSGKKSHQQQPSSVKIVVRNNRGARVRGGLKYVSESSKPQVKCAKIILRKKSSSSSNGSSTSGKFVTVDLKGEGGTGPSKEIKARICQIPKK